MAATPRIRASVRSIRSAHDIALIVAEKIGEMKDELDARRWRFGCSGAVEPGVGSRTVVPGTCSRTGGGSTTTDIIDLRVKRAS
jgi:hypothetical protein